MKIGALWKTTLQNGKTGYTGTLRYPGVEEKILLIPTDRENPKAPVFELILLDRRPPQNQTAPQTSQEPAPQPPTNQEGPTPF